MISTLHKKICYWFGTVGCSTLLGALGGSSLDYLLDRIHVDYAVIPQEYLFLGLRYGFFVGTVFAALQTVGVMSPLKPVKIGCALGLLCLILLTGVASGSIILKQLYELDWLDTSNWKLVNPKRYAISVGLLNGLKISSIIGFISGAIYLLIERKPKR